MAIYGRKKPFNITVQIGAMKSHYPQFKAIKHSEGKIEFIGKLVVKAELPIYTVSITYRGNSSPIVKVIDPPLVSNPPHFYSNTHSLCLFHPENFQWRGDRLISKVIVPWTASWIYFYEVWLQTGKWYGPEAHNNGQKLES